MARRLWIGAREKEILCLVAKGALLASMFVAPNIGKILRPLEKMTSKKRFYFRKRLKTLEDKDLIFLGGEKIQLTEEGKALISKIEKEEIVLDKSKKWNGVWQIVSYDIPNTKKKERDYFRNTLQRFGFYKVQKSLWIIPYPCEEEIAVLAQSLGLSPFVIYFTCEHLPMEGKYLRWFGLEQKYIPSRKNSS